MCRSYLYKYSCFGDITKNLYFSSFILNFFPQLWQIIFVYVFSHKLMLLRKK
nr:MAG TPA: hypothetical protein [Caudoviricetes sp.]